MQPPCCFLYHINHYGIYHIFKQSSCSTIEI